MSISQSVQGAISLLTVGQEIYQSIANAMDSAQSVSQNGADRKKWVLAFAKNLILEAGKDWTKWEKFVSDFIDAAKAIYNSLKKLF